MVVEIQVSNKQLVLVPAELLSPTELPAPHGCKGTCSCAPVCWQRLAPDVRAAPARQGAKETFCPVLLSPSALRVLGNGHHRHMYKNNFKKYKVDKIYYNIFQ